MPILKLAKSTGVGLKHFVGFRASRVKMRTYLAKLQRSDGAVTKAKVVGLMGLYAIYKGSPVGLAINIMDSAEYGVKDYKHRNAVHMATDNIEDDLEDLLVNTGMSADAAKRTMKLVRNGSYVDKDVAYMGPEDRAAFTRLIAELSNENGGTVNFGF